MLTQENSSAVIVSSVLMDLDFSIQAIAPLAQKYYLKILNVTQIRDLVSHDPIKCNDHWFSEMHCMQHHMCIYVGL